MLEVYYAFSKNLIKQWYENMMTNEYHYINVK